MVDLDQHWHSQICCRRLFKIWPFNSNPKWPQDDLRSKIPEHLERTSGQGSLHPSFIKSIESCRWRSILSVLNNDPKWPWPLDDLWPQIPDHPYHPPTWWSLCPSITKIHQDIFEKKHFLIVDGQIETQIDTQTHRYAISSSHLRYMN